MKYRIDFGDFVTRTSRATNGRPYSVFFGRDDKVIIEERQSTHVYRQKRLFTKEELEAREHLCVHEQPAYCNAACPLKLDTKAMAAAIAARQRPMALTLPLPIARALNT